MNEKLRKILVHQGLQFHMVEYSKKHMLDRKFNGEEEKRK